MFREGQGIVAQGVLIEPNRLLASEVLARHDEEYMPPALAEALKGIEHVPPSQWSDDDYRNNKDDDNESGGGYDR